MTGARSAGGTSPAAFARSGRQLAAAFFRQFQFQGLAQHRLHRPFGGQAGIEPGQQRGGGGPGRQHQPFRLQPLTVVQHHPPALATTGAFDRHDLPGQAAQACGGGIAVQGIEGLQRIELAIGRGVESTAGVRRQLRLERRQPVGSPDLQGQATLPPFLGQPLVPFPFLRVRCQQQQAPACRDRPTPGFQLLPPFGPEFQAALAEPPAATAGAVEHLGHQHTEGRPAAAQRGQGLGGVRSRNTIAQGWIEQQDPVAAPLQQPGRGQPHQAGAENDHRAGRRDGAAAGSQGTDQDCFSSCCTCSGRIWA
jgi:hypothetical protein